MELFFFKKSFSSMYLQSIVKYQHLDKGSVWDNSRTEKNTCPLCQYRGEDRVKETSKQEAWGKHLSFQGHIFYCTRGPGSNLRTPFPQQLQENDRMHWEAKFCVSIAISRWKGGRIWQSTCRPGCFHGFPVGRRNRILYCMGEQSIVLLNLITHR